MKSCGDTVFGMMMKVDRRHKEKEEQVRRGSCWRVGWPASSAGDARESDNTFHSTQIPLPVEGHASLIPKHAPLPNLPPPPTSQLPHRRNQNQDPIRPSLLPSHLAITTRTLASIRVDSVDSRSDVARIGVERLCRGVGSDVAQERAGQHGAYRFAALSLSLLACWPFRLRPNDLKLTACVLSQSYTLRSLSPSSSSSFPRSDRNRTSGASSKNRIFA
jgi:hypothetical protein